MNQSQQSSEAITKETDLSLKLLILGVEKWTKYLFQQWKVILFAGLLCGGLGLTYAYTKKVSYVAELTFVLEETKANPLGMYASLASQFGVDMGGGGNGPLSGNNIITFLKSRLIIDRTLLSTVTYEGQKIRLADLYVRIAKLNKKEEDAGSEFFFPLSTPEERFTTEQDSLLKVISTAIVKNNLLVDKPEKVGSFVLVKFSSTNELFSKLFTEHLVSEATSFYIETKAKKSRTNVDKLQQKADSLESLLANKTFYAAKSEDLNLNPARRVATVNAQLAIKDMTVIQVIYGEVLKNLELAKMNMAQETPLIQIVDYPKLPLKKEKLGKVNSILIGGFLGAILAVCILIIRKVYREVMK